MVYLVAAILENEKTLGTRLNLNERASRASLVFGSSLIIIIIIIIKIYHGNNNNNKINKSINYRNNDLFSGRKTRIRFPNDLIDNNNNNNNNNYYYCYYKLINR